MFDFCKAFRFSCNIKYIVIVHRHVYDESPLSFCEFHSFEDKNACEMFVSCLSKEKHYHNIDYIVFKSEK